MKPVIKNLFIITIILFGSMTISAVAQNNSNNLTSSPPPSSVSIKYEPPCLLPNALGGCPEIGNSITNYLIRLYNFAVGIAGILAVGTIVIGAIMISFSGAVDKKREGKEMIQSAIWGIVLLFGSYLILNTINPSIVTLSEPTLQKVENFTDNTIDSIRGLTQSPNSGAEIYMVNCNFSNFSPENACQAPLEWPHVTINQEGLIKTTNNRPDYQCKNIIDSFFGGGLATSASTTRICMPTSLDNLFNKKFKIFNALYADGSLVYRKKLAENDCQQCVNLNPQIVPIKNNDQCSLEGGGVNNRRMSNCVCITSYTNKNEPLNCFLNRNLFQKLDMFKDKIKADQRLSEYQKKWHITEAWPPTVDHSSLCHFQGTCFDMSIDTDDCNIVNIFINIAHSYFSRVINENKNCGGANTPYHTGNHLHIEL